MVDANIQKWVQRLKKVQKSGKADVAVIHGPTNDNIDRGDEGRNEDDWNDSQIPENIIDDTGLDLRGSRRMGKPYSTPGPRYNPRETASRILSKQVQIAHGDESTVRDIRFGNPPPVGVNLRGSYLPKGKLASIFFVLTILNILFDCCVVYFIAIFQTSYHLLIHRSLLPVQLHNSL